jgi:hypothetical protein
VKILPLFREDDPDIRASVPGTAAVVAEDTIDRETCAVQPISHPLD